MLTSNRVGTCVSLGWGADIIITTVEANSYQGTDAIYLLVGTGGGI